MDTFKEAKEAVDRLFSDKSVTRSKTKALLEQLRDDIDTCLDTLSDVEAEEPETDDTEVDEDDV